MCFVKWHMCEIYLPVLCWKITLKISVGVKKEGMG